MGDATSTLMDKEVSLKVVVTELISSMIYQIGAKLYCKGAVRGGQIPVQVRILSVSTKNTVARKGIVP